MIIDANNQIIGRIASAAAKQALLGQEIAIINCEKGVISGKKESTLAKYKRKRDMGVPRKGPYMSRMPDRFVRRIVRGMLPMAKGRGRDSFKKIMCYIGTPDDFKGKDSFKVPGADATKLPTLHKVTVGEICKHLGGSWRE